MMIEFEPSRLTLTEARALVALILAHQPHAAPAPSEPELPLRVTLPAAPFSAEEVFGQDAPPAPVPDPAEAFGAPAGPLASGSAAAPVAPAPDGSTPAPTSGAAGASSPSAPVSPHPTATGSAPSAMPPPDTSASAMPAPVGSPAPAASSPTTPAAPSQTGTLDSAGLPWDERIHSANKARNADATWRKRRGVEDAVTATVTAELRQSFPDPRAANAAALAAAAASPAAAVAVAPIPAAPPPPAPPAPPAPAAPPAPGGSPTDFTGTLRRLTMWKNEGKITQEQINEALTVCGLGNISELIKGQEHLPTFNAMLDQFAAG